MQNRLTVNDMVDMAIAPETSVVNFRILHALLKVLTNKLAMETALVEFKDSNTCTGLKLEQLVGESENLNNTNRTIVTQYCSKEAKGSESEYVLCDSEKNNNVQEKFVISSTKPTETELQSVVLPQQTEEPSSTVDINNEEQISLNSLQEPTAKMEKVSETIKSTETAMVTKNKEFSKTITSSVGTNATEFSNDAHQRDYDKRIELVENEIVKITAAFEGLTRNFTSFTNTVAPFVEGGEIDAIRDRIDDLERHCCKVETNESPELVFSGNGADNKETSKKLPSNGATHSPRPSTSMPRSSALNRLNILTSEVDGLKNDMNDMKNLLKTYNVTVNDDVEQNQPTDGTSSVPLNVENRPGWQARVAHLEKKLFEMEKDFLELREKFSQSARAGVTTTSPKNSSDDIESNPEIEAINHTIEILKMYMERLQECCDFLLNEKDAQNERIDSISGDLETVKNVKADKDDVTVALMDKADFSQVQKKVSVDQFDATKRDLSKNIVDLISKLTEKEENWRKMIDELKDLVANKLGKEDVAPLKEFIDEKIKKLQTRLTALTALKEQAEAAGTRSRVIKDLNCISCNADVMMRIDPCPAVARSYELPINFKQCLTKKLDEIRLERKLRAASVNLNLNHLEESMKINTTCLRYLGGSHTKIDHKTHHHVNHHNFTRPHSSGISHCYRSYLHHC